MATYKLGRVASRADPRNLRLATYLQPHRVHAAPMGRDWTHPPGSLTWGMFANDRLGTCTVAALAHLFQAQAANNGRDVAISEEDVIGLYERVGGYDPGRPESDQGAQMLDVLRAMREVGIAGQRVSAFVEFDPREPRHLESAVNMFGGAYVGVDLPRAAVSQTVWDIRQAGEAPAPYARGSWGPHSMALLGYDRLHLWFVSWGAIRIATVDWFHQYVAEAFVVIDPLWVDEGFAPSGFDLQQLRSDLVDIHRGAKDPP